MVGVHVHKLIAACDREQGGTACLSLPPVVSRRVWAAALTLTLSTEPSRGQECEGQRRTQPALSRGTPLRLLITRGPAPSFLPFLVLGGSKRNPRSSLLLVFFFKSLSLGCVPKPSDRKEECWLLALVMIFPIPMQLGRGNQPPY